MHLLSRAGAALVVAGLAGYVVGVVVPYPGRAFSLTAFMIGTVLVAIGRTDTEEAHA